MVIKPCPLCGGSKTEIREQTYSTGMRSVVSAVNLIHWCDKQEDNYVTSTVSIRARTEEQAINTWNKRSE